MLQLVLHMAIFSLLAFSSLGQDISSQQNHTSRYDTAAAENLSYDTSQHRIISETQANKDSTPNPGIPFLNVFQYDFYTTIDWVEMTNEPNGTEPSNLTLYYNVNLNNRLTVKNFSYTFYFYNEYSYKSYKDSLALKAKDGFNLKNSFQWKIAKSMFNISASANIRSQFWKSYIYEVDSAGALEKQLYSDYLSPGYKLFSLGFVYRNKHHMTLELGLVGGKSTVVRNQNIFEARHKDELYGLEKGQKRKNEWGINLVFNAPIIPIHKNIFWENNTIVYCNNRELNSLKQYSLNLNNAFHFVIRKKLRLSLRNQINYDIKIQEKVFISNQLTLGFYLSNAMKGLKSRAVKK